MQATVSLTPIHMSRPRGNKTFFMLNSAENEIYPAHKCENVTVAKS